MVPGELQIERRLPAEGLLQGWGERWMEARVGDCGHSQVRGEGLWTSFWFLKNLFVLSQKSLCMFVCVCNCVYKCLCVCACMYVYKCVCMLVCS